MSIIIHRFESSSNQEVLADIKKEIGSIHPEIEQKEISSNYWVIIIFKRGLLSSCLIAGACKTYFRSLKDDNRRKSKGVFNIHRKDLKVRKRLKQV